MARSLIQCMQASGYQVETTSQLRARVSDPHDTDHIKKLVADAEQEVSRLRQQWQSQGAPDCWFCYHPYYKSPDLIGPTLCKAFQVPYVTAEASLSHRRNDGFWESAQLAVLESVNLAKANLYFTERDRAGLYNASEGAQLVHFPPFIKPLAYKRSQRQGDSNNLVTVAMMRSGDKLDSYRYLAQALAPILTVPWVLHVVGDGPALREVRALFDAIPADRIVWHGKKNGDEIAAVFARSSLYVWPGCGEAYGLAYLEAQSAGLPVVAFKTAGVPEVVAHGISGVLVENTNVPELSNAITHLLTNRQELKRQSENAWRYIEENHTFEKASRLLERILSDAIGDTR